MPLLPVMVPAFVSVPPGRKIPYPLIDADAALVTEPPACNKTPMPPVAVPELTAVPRHSPPQFHTPDRREARVGDRTASTQITPTPRRPSTAPELTTVPAPRTIDAVVVALIDADAALVTEPPSIKTPPPTVEVPTMVPELTTVPTRL